MSTQTDFDERMRRLVNEAVDQRVGVRRPAPPFVPPAPVRRRPAPWLLPLAVAAIVAALVVGTVGIVHWASGDHKVTQPGNSDSGTPDPTPSTSYRTVRVGAAEVAIPTDWTVRAYPHNGQSGDLFSRWCLLPAGSNADAQNPDSCPITFYQDVIGGDNVPSLLPDDRGGLYGDPPQPCVPGHPTSTAVGVAQRSFGGRAAEYRSFDIDCSDGSGLRWEQYVVPTDRAYVAYTAHADRDDTQAALDVLAQHTVLPDQDRPLRLADYGIVRSAQRDGKSTVIRLDRVAEADGSNPDPATYRYVVPDSVLQGRARPTVGDKITVFTNGYRVVGFQ